MAATRKHAHKRQDIFKKSYDEIIKSAKRKHGEEFYIFKTVIGSEELFSECSVDAMESSLEHCYIIKYKDQNVEIDFE